MAIVSIPCSPAGQPSWMQRTTIAGRDYQLTFQWVQRDGHWWFSLADQDGAPITSGVKLVTNWPLLRGVTDTRRPPGNLMVVDGTGVNDLDPGFSDLGTRFLLMYADPSDLVGTP